MKDFSDLRCDWFHAEDLRNIADERRNLLWPEDSMPIDIEFLISRRLNINIEPIKGLFKTLSSNCFLSFDRSIIKVDQYAYMSGRFEGKINFDLAHEVGHFFLHEEIYKDLEKQILSIDDYYDFQRTAPERTIHLF